MQIYDLHDITTGKAIYGADVQLPGMKYAVVARPPVVGGKVKSVDSAAALKVPGVEKVVQIAGSIPPAKFAALGGVAVVANSTWAALQGRDALTIEWDDGPHGSYNTEQFHKEMSATAAQPGKVIRNHGDVDAAFAQAAKTFTQEYYQPHMAHIAMEPPAALVNVANGKAEVWAPVQSPWGAREDVGEDARHEDRERQGQRHASGRRFRAQVAVRFRARGGGAVQGGWGAGAGAVDPRGRHPAQLLSHHLGRADRGGARRQGQGHRLAASQRRAVDHLDLPGG